MSKHTEEVDDFIERTAKDVLRDRDAWRVPVDRYLALGAFLYSERIKHKAAQVYGKVIVAKCPTLAKYYPSERSNILWFYKAVKGIKNADFLKVLGVECAGDLRTTNPCYLRQKYRRLKRKMAADAA